MVSMITKRWAGLCHRVALIRPGALGGRIRLRVIRLIRVIRVIELLGLLGLLELLRLVGLLGL